MSLFPRVRRWGLALCLSLFAGTRFALAQGGTTAPYIDPRQQTAVTFGQRSQWLQPWRGYMETRPASVMLEAAGANLNVPPGQAEAVCAQLAKNGFTRVRFEMGWGEMTEDDPPRLRHPADFAMILRACQRHGLRPLILLNSNEGEPCPMHTFYVRLQRPAQKGDRTILIHPEDAGKLVPGRSGISNLTSTKAAEVLFTKLDPGGTVHLSKPLPKALPPGLVSVSTLKYAPFYPVRRTVPGGIPPETTQTLNGWLAYVRALGKTAKDLLGTEGKSDAGFDFEIWNELTFGSSFLVANGYYETPVGTGDVPIDDIRTATATLIHDPKNGLSGAGLCDGFNNQWPWGSGANEPVGITALGKHPYHNSDNFQGKPEVHASQPLDALGHPEGVAQNGNDGHWRDSFEPAYVDFFPEYYLTAIQTEHSIRDLSPITTSIGGTPHGKATHPTLPDGRPALSPQFWVTETSLQMSATAEEDWRAFERAFQSGSAADRAEKAAVPSIRGTTTGDAAHLIAKSTLRYLASWIGCGADRIYFYAARFDGDYGPGLLSRRFAQAVDAGQSTDSDTLTSPALFAVRRLMEGLKLPPGESLTRHRSLSLFSVSDRHDHVQFAGDPATAKKHPNPHPPLYDRDCVAFFPFQVSDGRFVIPVYVMTRDIAHLYDPGAPLTDVTRTDLPDEVFRLKLRGLHGTPKVALTDPVIGGRKVDGVRVVETAPDGTVTVEIPLSDSVRLLTITDTPAPPPARSKVK